MPVKTNRLELLSSRASQDVPLLDDPPVGHLQAIVLKKLDELGKEAFGFNVLEQLSLETGVWIDPSQVYASIRKLVNDKGYIEHVETRRSQEGGPPLKIYKLTAAGRAALKTVAAHHQAVADYLNDKRKATRR
jgi:DNA-binding PadR family transcriptional regulator